MGKLESEDKSATTGIAKTDVKAPDELVSEDKSATTGIVKTDVKALQPMAKPVTERPAVGLPEYTISVAQETFEPPGGARVLALGELEIKVRSLTTEIVVTDVKAPERFKS